MRDAGLADSPRWHAAVALAREMAEAVDEDPRDSRLISQYRGALSDLAEVTSSGSGDAEAFDRLLAQLSAPVGDASTS